MSRSKKRKKNIKERTIGYKITEYIKNNYGKAVIFVVGSVVTLLLTKACDQIMPSQPTVVEKIPDTIQVVHVYDSLYASAMRINMQQTEESLNSMLRKQSGNITNQKQNKSVKVNKLFTSANFPNAKGYASNSAAQYFSLEMSSLKQSYVDFTLDFFDENILEEIYCLSVKICKLQEGKKFLVLDANYEKRIGKNLIRLKNIFTDGNYDVEVGFFLNKDRNSKYPNFYKESRYINKAEKKE